MQRNPNLLTNILIARLRAGEPKGVVRLGLLLRVHDVTELSMKELRTLRIEQLHKGGPAA